MKRCTGATLAILLLVTPTPGQGEKKPPRDPREVEARLSDGSRVHMTLIDETLTVVTKYGTLTVPTRDIRKIEFGVRPSEGIGKSIDEAIHRLGSQVFKERDDASKQLIAYGPLAYRAVAKATKNSDPEVVKRAQEVLEKIRQKHSPSELHVPEDDMVRTLDFTIAGRITNPTIRARTPIFGETQLRLSDLRGMRSLGTTSEVEVMVEATKYAVRPSQWMDTGVDVNTEDEISVTATGQMDMMTTGMGQYVTGPAGNAQWGRGTTGHPPGALLGRISESGPIFLIGESYKGTSKKEGRLYLQVSPSQFGNNVSGAYQVTITGGRESMDH